MRISEAIRLLSAKKFEGAIDNLMQAAADSKDDKLTSILLTETYRVAYLKALFNSKDPAYEDAATTAKKRLEELADTYKPQTLSSVMFRTKVDRPRIMEKATKREKIDCQLDLEEML